jgi:hypothetical protein
MPSPRTSQTTATPQQQHSKQGKHSQISAQFSSLVANSTRKAMGQPFQNGKKGNNLRALGLPTQHKALATWS